MNDFEKLFENILSDSPENSSWKFIEILSNRQFKYIKNIIIEKNIKIDSDENLFCIFISKYDSKEQILEFRSKLLNYGILIGLFELDLMEKLKAIFGNNFSIIGKYWIYIKIELDNSKIPIITATIGQDFNKIYRCISHINEYTKNYIQYIIDNGSQYEVSKKIKNLCDGNRQVYIRHSANQLGAINRNLILKNTKNKYCAIVDDDVYVCENWLEKGIKTIELYDSSFVYIISKNKDILFHYDILFDGFNLFSLDYRKKLNEVKLLDKKIKQCAVLPTACCVMRTEDIQKVGCFSEEYAPVLFEDFDLCLKLHEASFSLFMIGSIQCEHEFETTTGIMTRYMKINGEKFKKRWQHRYIDYGFAKYVLNKSASHFETIGN